MSRDHEKMPPAVQTFSRVLSIHDALPARFKPSDETPLREILPGVWPTVADLRSLVEWGATLDGWFPLYRDPPHEPNLRVKPLEWRKGYCDERVTIHQASNGWLYQVRILDGVVWLDWPDRAATQFPSEEAAKEAVQSDYERRVLASLADPTR